MAKNKQTPPEDPIERIVRLALVQADVRHTRPTGAHGELDFHLTDHDVHVECKQFHSPRIAGQMARFPDVIAIQGRKAAHAFAAMITGTPTAAKPEPTHAKPARADGTCPPG